MKKMIVALTVLAVMGGVFFLAGSAFAQTPDPQSPPFPWGGMMGQGQGRGMMGQGRGMMQPGADFTRGQGLMHDEMVTAFASELGLAVEALQKQLNAGKTLWQVAEDQGLSAEQFQQAWTEARAEALDAAVKAGKLTQEQADGMKSRGGGRMGGRGRGMNPACPNWGGQ